MMKRCILLVCYLATVSGRSFTDVRRQLRSDVAYNQRNHHQQGQFKYGYAVKQGETQFHHQRSLDGAMYGCYGFVDPQGKLFITHYLADMAGYRLVNMANPDRKLIERLKNQGTAENPINLQKLFPHECQDDGDIVMLQQSAEKMKTASLSEEQVIETRKYFVLKPAASIEHDDGIKPKTFDENKVEPSATVKVKQDQESPIVKKVMSDSGSVANHAKQPEAVVSVVNFVDKKHDNDPLPVESDQLVSMHLDDDSKMDAIPTTEPVPEYVTEQVNVSESDEAVDVIDDNRDQPNYDFRLQENESSNVDSVEALLSTTIAPFEDQEVSFHINVTGEEDMESSEKDLVEELAETTVMPFTEQEITTETNTVKQMNSVVDDNTNSDEIPHNEPSVQEQSEPIDDLPQENLKFDDVEYSFVPIPVKTDSTSDIMAGEGQKLDQHTPMDSEPQKNVEQGDSVPNEQTDSKNGIVIDDEKSNGNEFQDSNSEQTEQSPALQNDFEQHSSLVNDQTEVEPVKSQSVPNGFGSSDPNSDDQLNKLNKPIKQININVEFSKLEKTKNNVESHAPKVQPVKTVFRGNVKYSNYVTSSTKNSEMNMLEDDKVVKAGVSNSNQVPNSPANANPSLVQAEQDKPDESTFNDSPQAKIQTTNDNKPESSIAIDQPSMEYAFNTRSKPDLQMMSNSNSEISANPEAAQVVANHVDQNDNSDLLRSLPEHDSSDEEDEQDTNDSNEIRELALSVSRIGPLPNIEESEMDDMHSADSTGELRAVNSKLPATPRTTSANWVGEAEVGLPTIASGTDRVPVTPNPTVDFRPFTPDYHLHALSTVVRAGSTIGSNGDIYDELEEDVELKAVDNQQSLTSGVKTDPTETSTSSTTTSTTTAAPETVPVNPPSFVSSGLDNSNCYVVMLSIPITAQQVIIKTDSPQFRVYGGGDPEERIKLIEPGVYEVNVGTTSSIKFQHYGIPSSFLPENKVRLDLGKNFNYEDLVPKPLYNRRIYQQGPIQPERDNINGLNNPYLPLYNNADISSASPSQARSVSVPQQTAPQTNEQQALTADQRALLSLVPSWKKVQLYY